MDFSLISAPAVEVIKTAAMGAAIGVI